MAAGAERLEDAFSVDQKLLLLHPPHSLRLVILNEYYKQQDVHLFIDFCFLLRKAGG